MSNYDFSFGLVAANGRREYGGNRWSSQRIQTGKYRIDFDNRFENRPAITVTPEQTAGSAPVSAIISTETAGDRRRFAVIELALASGQRADLPFHFIAISEDD